MAKYEFDGGRNFDWGKTSEDYAKYRDIYPESLCRKLLDSEIGQSGQNILDLGTGTAVFPRMMHRFGGNYTGIDASENQIKMARKLVDQMGVNIRLECCAAEAINFSEAEFDVITAIQCWHYFDLDKLLPQLLHHLKSNGRLVIVNFYWLPEECDLVKASEELILKYNPAWTGGGIRRVQVQAERRLSNHFKISQLFTYDEDIPFTTESWLGRIRSSRAIGATLSPDQIKAFDREHTKLIQRLRPNNFTVLHQITMEVYQLLT